MEFVFLYFYDNTFTYDLYYNIIKVFMTDFPLSLYVTLPSSIFILIIGVLVWIRNKGKNQLLFFFLTLIQFAWAFGAYIFYKSHVFGMINEHILVGKILLLSLFFIPVFIYNFTVELCKNSTNWQKAVLFFSYIFSIFFVLFVNNEELINGLFFYKLDLSRIIHYLYLAFIAVLLLLSIRNLYNCWKYKTDKMLFKDKLTIILLLISVLGLIFIDFLPIYNINLYPILYLTIPIYLLIIVQVLLKRYPFESIITVDVLIGAILVILSSLIIFKELEISNLFKAIVFLVVAISSFVILEYINFLKEEKISHERQIKERVKELEDDRKNIEEINGLLDKNDAILEMKVKERMWELKEMNHTLERILSEREGALKRKTKELEEKMKELQEFGNIFVNREDRMIELKDRIKQLENKLKEK